MSEVIRLASKSNLSFSDISCKLLSTLLQPDLEAFHILLAAAAAHHVKPHGNPPVWLLTIGASGSGKTTILETLSTVKGVYRLNDLTPKTFMSGYHNGKNPEKDNSLLAKLGTSAIICMKDFTTVISMRHENKAEIMAQLREIYDGFYRKAWGMGEAQSWAGRITMLACCTPAVDRDRMTFRQMGDRFMEVRWIAPEPAKLSRHIISSPTAVDLAPTQEIVKEYISTCQTKCPSMTPAQVGVLESLACMTARLRTPVIRDEKGWRIVEIGSTESPSRISQALTSVVLTSASLDHEPAVRDSDMALAVRLAHDSIPPGRLTVIGFIGKDGTPASCKTEIPLTRWTRDRVLEELLALSILDSSMASGEDWFFWNEDITPPMNTFISNLKPYCLPSA